MSLEQYAYLADIIGVSLVIASLVYVARQLHQNTAAQLATSRHAMMAADLHLLSMSMDYPESAFGLGVASAQDIRSTAFLIAFLRIREFAWYQFKSGILDKTTWESYLAPSAVVFASEHARAVWNSDVIRLDPDFRALINELIGAPASGRRESPAG